MRLRQRFRKVLKITVTSVQLPATICSSRDDRRCGVPQARFEENRKSFGGFFLPMRGRDREQSKIPVRLPLGSDRTRSTKTKIEEKGRPGDIKTKARSRPRLRL